MSTRVKVLLVLGILGGLILISFAVYNIFFTKEEAAVFRPPVPVEEDFSEEFNKVFIQSEQALDLSSQVTTKKGEARKKAVDEARQKLIERKRGLVNLMQKDPNLAWAIIYPPTVLEKIPQELRGEVEQSIRIKAELDIIHFDDFAGGKSKFIYYLNTYDKGQLQKSPFYIVGRAPEVLSGSEVEVHGYQLDDSIIADVQGGTVNVIRLAERESLGNQRTLVVLVNFLDSKQPPPLSARQANKLVFGDRVKDFYSKASYGKTSFTGEVAGWYTLQRNAKLEGQSECKYPEIEEVYPLIKGKFNFKNYDRFILLANISTTLCNRGYGTVGKIFEQFDGIDYRFSVASMPVDSNWLSEGSSPIPSWRWLDSVISHELGHNLGINHANSWECPGGEIFAEDCLHREYGNRFDVMGFGVNSLHFNARFKEAFGWLGEESSLAINKSGTYSLKPIEEDAGVRLAKIQDPRNNTYYPFYLEYRRGVNFDSNLNTGILSVNQNGLFVNSISFGGSFASELLDMNPGGGWDVVALPEGNQVFKDIDRGITIGPVRSTDSQKITFDVGFSEPECRRFSPNIEIIQPRLSIAPGNASAGAFSIFNRDGFGCGASEFKILLEKPSRWIGGILTGDAITDKVIVKLAPESSSYFGFYRLSVPKDAKSGNYPVELVVKNLSGGLSNKQRISINVVAPGDSSGTLSGSTEGAGAPPTPNPLEPPPATTAAPEPGAAPAPTAEPSPPAPAEEPTAAPKEGEQPLGITPLVAAFYKWALGIGALIALLVLIYGGIVYTTSAGNESRIGEAKEWVFGALIGLFILFGSYVILNTINPELTKLKDISLIINKPAEDNKEPASSNPGPSPVDQGVSLPPPLPSSLSGGCNSCTDISAIEGIIIKNNKLANIELAKKLTVLVNLTKSESSLGWRVTEAFPPTVKHISSCHYDGTCIDIALLDNPPTCAQVDKLEQIVQQAGFVVVNEYSGCGGTQFSTTTGGHLHIR